MTLEELCHETPEGEYILLKRMDGKYLLAMVENDSEITLLGKSYVLKAKD